MRSLQSTMMAPASRDAEDGQAIPGIIGAGSEAAIDVPQAKLVKASLSGQGQQLLPLLGLLERYRGRYGQGLDACYAGPRPDFGQSIECSTLRLGRVVLDLRVRADADQLDVSGSCGLLLAITCRSS